jgi:uncharacterized protein (TIGR02611 family)
MSSANRGGVKRYLKIAGGFALVFAGVIMIFTPGPGWPAIVVGLGLLAAEFLWARRLLDRIKAGGGRLRNAFLSRFSS